MEEQVLFEAFQRGFNEELEKNAGVVGKALSSAKGLAGKAIGGTKGLAGKVHGKITGTSFDIGNKLDQAGLSLMWNDPVGRQRISNAIGKALSSVGGSMSSNVGKNIYGYGAVAGAAGGTAYAGKRIFGKKK